MDFPRLLAAAGLSSAGCFVSLPAESNEVFELDGVACVARYFHTVDEMHTVLAAGAGMPLFVNGGLEDVDSLPEGVYEIPGLHEESYAEALAQPAASNAVKWAADWLREPVVMKLVKPSARGTHSASGARTSAWNRRHVAAVHDLVDRLGVVIENRIAGFEALLSSDSAKEAYLALRLHHDLHAAECWRHELKRLSRGGFGPYDFATKFNAWIYHAHVHPATFQQELKALNELTSHAPRASVSRRTDWVRG